MKSNSKNIFLIIFIAYLIFFPHLNNAIGFESLNGIKLVPSSKTYLVVKNANIRAMPKNKSNRVGRLLKYERIEAVGRARRTNWIAVRKNDKNLGFVYRSVLVPVINGKLEKSISEKISIVHGSNNSPPCSYKIDFLGKDKVQGNLQIMSDYALNMKCGDVGIEATMFLTELPYLANRKPIYQVNIDIYNIPRGSEDIFSTTILYNGKLKKLKFDSVNKLSFRSSEEIAERTVPNLSEALKVAYKSWGQDFWLELTKMKVN